MLQLHNRRCWIIVLVSCMAIAVWSSSPEVARANGGEYGIDSDYDLRSPNSPPPPIGTGDPDMPSGTARQSGRSIRDRGNAGSLRGQLAPEGALTAHEMMSMRLWIALRNLRLYALHR